MTDQSRTSNTIRNLLVGLGGRFFQYALSFINRTVFINILAIEYLGVNGLFTNILAMLALAELGVGGAFVSLLYKPLHDKDTDKLKSLMTAFKKAYMLIGISVGIAGLILYPFLDIIIKDNSIENINLIYLMFLTGSVSSYFYAHKIALLRADQKSYISTIYRQIFVFIQYAMQIVVLWKTHNFIVYLTIQIICPLLGNFVLAGKINSLYPFLKGKGLPLDKKTVTDLKEKVSASMFHHLGFIILNGTDSIVISAFLGVYYVGLYSNYLMLIGVITSFSLLAFDSVTASVGNLTASSDNRKSFDIFQKMQFFNFFIAGFCSVCFVTLFNPFISLWIGSEYLLPQYIVVLIVIVFYCGRAGMQKSINIFKTTTGLFYRDRYFTLMEGLINVSASLFLVLHWGLAGVFVGSIIAMLSARIWTEPYFVFKYLFERPLSDYFVNYFKYGTATVATTGLVYYLTDFIPHNTWIGFIIMAISCSMVAFGIFVLLFFKTKEFRYFYQLFCSWIKKIRGHAAGKKAIKDAEQMMINGNVDG